MGECRQRIFPFERILRISLKPAIARRSKIIHGSAYWGELQRLPSLFRSVLFTVHPSPIFHHFPYSEEANDVGVALGVRGGERPELMLPK